MNFRLLLWCWWHMRPGHKPYALVRARSGTYCALCGSAAPQI